MGRHDVTVTNLLVSTAESLNASVEKLSRNKDGNSALSDLDFMLGGQPNHCWQLCFPL